VACPVGTVRYHAPTTVKEVVGLIANLEDAKVPLEGRALSRVGELRVGRFDHLLDLNRVPDIQLIE
jgi:hypothetical protein